MNSEQSLLLLRMEPVSDFLGDQGGVAAGAVVDNEVTWSLPAAAFSFCEIEFGLTQVGRSALEVEI